MNVRMLIVIAGLAAVVAGCSSGGEESEPTPIASDEPVATATTVSEGVAAGQVMRGKSLRSSDGLLEISGTGSTALDVSVREMGSDTPDEPFGWKVVGTVYEITASEPGREVVERLKEPVELRFDVSVSLATVMYFDGEDWRMLESELARGTLRAEADHLSLFAVMTPTIATSTAPGEAPSGAAADLEAEIEKLRKEGADVPTAGIYTGTAHLELPAPLAEALAGADVPGDLYHGVYNGVNQAFIVGSTPEGVTGDFTLLMEPTLKFPKSSSEAQRTLAELFPGATGQVFAAVTELPAMYAYQSSGPKGFIVLGFIQHKGVYLAYVAVGSGAFAGAATDAKD